MYHKKVEWNLEKDREGQLLGGAIGQFFFTNAAYFLSFCEDVMLSLLLIGLRMYFTITFIFNCLP
jgi:hypothetical protein